MSAQRISYHTTADLSPVTSDAGTHQPAAALVNSASAIMTSCPRLPQAVVHCASAEQLNDEDVVAASGDQRLLAAWSEPGRRHLQYQREERSSRRDPGTGRSTWPGTSHAGDGRLLVADLVK